MKRFTVTDLRATIERINQRLEAVGSLLRFEERGRYGYQGVDEYNVNPDGTRNGSYVNRTIETGTSRECAQTALIQAGHIENKILRDKVNSK